PILGCSCGRGVLGRPVSAWGPRGFGSGAGPGGPPAPPGGGGGAARGPGRGGAGGRGGGRGGRGGWGRGAGGPRAWRRRSAARLLVEARGEVAVLPGAGGVLSDGERVHGEARQRAAGDRCGDRAPCSDRRRRPRHRRIPATRPQPLFVLVVERDRRRPLRARR